MIEKNKIVYYGKKSKHDNNIILVNEQNFIGQYYDTQNNLLTLNELRNLESKSVNNKSFPELFSFNKISLWWFLYPRLSQKFLQYIPFMNNFLNFIESEKPYKIKIVDDFNTFDLIKEICMQKNISLDFNKLNYFKFKTKKRIRHYLRKIKAKSIIRKKIEQRKRLFYGKHSSIPSIDKKIIFVSYPIYRRHIFNINNKKTEKGEFIIQDIINLINDQDKIVGIDLFSQVLSNDLILEERLNSKMLWLPVEVFLKDSTNSKDIKGFLKKYDELLHTKEFQNLFEFKQIKYWNQLKDDFDEMKFSYYLPYWICLIISLKKFFKEHKPQCIFLMYEHGSNSLSFISVCKQLGIPTIGLQHGMIYDHHEQYCFNNFSTKNNPYGFPFPDKMVLFGEYFKNLLLKKGYPKDSLITFGNSSFFNLKKIESTLESKSLLEKYKIDKNKKIILFASTGLQESYEATKQFNYDSQIWDYILKNFKNDDRYFWILKPRPLEKIDIYQDIYKKNGYPSNAKIIQGSLHELIYSSYIVISTYSTTIIDALCFKKPIIQIEFDNIKYPINLGNSVKTIKLNDLKDTLEKVANDPTIINELQSNSIQFIKDFYNIPEQNPRTIIDKLIEDQ